MYFPVPPHALGNSSTLLGKFSRKQPTRKHAHCLNVIESMASNGTRIPLQNKPPLKLRGSCCSTDGCRTSMEEKGCFDACASRTLSLSYVHRLGHLSLRGSAKRATDRRTDQAAFWMSLEFYQCGVPRGSVDGNGNHFSQPIQPNITSIQAVSETFREMMPSARLATAYRYSSGRQVLCRWIDCFRSYLSVESTHILYLLMHTHLEHRQIALLISQRAKEVTVLRC